MSKKYDNEFKLQTVRLIQEEGKSVAQVAREMGLHENTLYRWVAEFKKNGTHAFPGSGKLKPEDKAQRDLQKRIRDLEEENEILKKAMHYFAKVEYITCFYNGKRIHSSIGYLTPNQFERMFQRVA